MMAQYQHAIRNAEECQQVKNISALGMFSDKPKSVPAINFGPIEEQKRQDMMEAQ